jgi:predicted lipase
LSSFTEKEQEFIPKTGFLKKKATNYFSLQPWVSRKFTLGPPDFVLRYYNDDDTVRGSFQLQTVKMIPSTVDETFVFEIVGLELFTNKSKSLLLRADSQKDVDDWIVCVQFCIDNPLPWTAEIADSKDCQLCKKKPEPGRMLPWYWYSCKICGKRTCGEATCKMTKASVTIPQTLNYAGPVVPGFGSGVCMASDCQEKYNSISECRECHDSPDKHAWNMVWKWYKCTECSSNLCSKCTQSAIYDNQILLCKMSTTRKCVEINFKSHRIRISQVLLQEFLQIATSGEINEKIVEQMNQKFWCKPTVAKSFNLQKKAETVLRLIDMVYPIGKEIKYFFGAVKFIQSRQFQLFWEFILGNRIQVLKPLLDLMNQRGSTGILPHPCDIGDLHYYTCYLEQHRKLEDVEISSDSLTVKTLKRSPEDIMDLLGKYVGCAQWMYIANLKSPHNTGDWNSWYISQVIERNGFTLLLFVGEDKTTLPNGVTVPAFCLAANSDTKEVILNIRGTVTDTDVWEIDLNYDLDDFEYFEIHGKVQHGFYIGAKEILDYFGVRETILSLVTSGYNIRIAGHSMGAAVAVIIAADLRYHHDGVFREENLLCFAYACPPCFSDDLGLRLTQDNFVFCMVNADDLVPRITKDALSNFKEG